MGAHGQDLPHLPRRGGAAATPPPRSPRSVGARRDVVDLVRSDHAEMLGMVRGLEQTRSAGDRHLLRQRAEHRILVLIRSKQEVLYPWFRSTSEQVGDRRLHAECREFHSLVEHAFADLASAPPESERFTGILRVLGLLVRRGVACERRLLARARRLMPRSVLVPMADDLQQRRTELMVREARGISEVPVPGRDEDGDTSTWHRIVRGLT